jgi:very-short-patch-repair endonuclease
MDDAARSALLALAAGQQSLFTTAQAEASGVSRKVLLGWSRSGRIVAVRRGVWSISGVAPNPRRSALAVLLAHGPASGLCRDSAGWVWDLPGHELGPIQVVRVHDDHGPAVGRLHTSRSMVATSDLTERHGLRVTTPVRTIFDLAAQQHPDRTARDLNSLCSRGLVTLDLLNDGLDRLAVRGRAGIRTMRQLIDDLRRQGAPAGSNLELRVERLFPLAGLRGMRRQVELGDEHGFIARVDFADLDLGLVIEVDSDRFHHGLVDRQLDAVKTARLEALGLTVVRITERDVWFDEASVVAQLRQAANGVRTRRSLVP